MDQWIAKAESALRTGQPNLAMLYMRRGLSESRAGRSWLASYDLAMAIREWGAAFRRMRDAVLGPDAQVSYALAGPSKGLS